MCSFFEVLLFLVNSIESVDVLSNVKHVAFCQLEKDPNQLVWSRHEFSGNGILH